MAKTIRKTARKNRTASSSRTSPRRVSRRASQAGADPRIKDRVLCVIVKHGEAADAKSTRSRRQLPHGQDEKSQSTSSSAQREDHAGSVGAMVHTSDHNVEVRVPMPVVHGLLKMTRFLPESWSDAVFDFLAKRGIALDRNHGGDIDQRLLEQIMKLDVDVKTATLHVKVWTE